MRQSLLDRLLQRPKKKTLLRTILAGSLYKMSDMRGSTSLADIKTQIDTMRALARDSQISTALSYYATDATTTNTAGQIIWATPKDKSNKDVANIVNQLFERWNVSAYARDHILELATIGNLYIPTTEFYREDRGGYSKQKVSLDNNTVVDTAYDIVPSTKIPPEDIIHLWYRGEPSGYMYQPTDDKSRQDIIQFSESGVIHFSLGGLLGDYTIDTIASDKSTKTYDIQFAQPLMDKAVQPTQTLNLLEDALLLSSLTRIVKFINVECNNAEETEIQANLQQIKDAIEQQLAINTSTGDAQSFVNPQSPNNLIYLPKINGQDAISITDLNMTEATEQDSKLLDYYQDKKLSVLGVPKEALNFSSSEGLGGAGQVMSQRSALYANSLQRLETAYIAGWKSAIDKYFTARGMSGFIGKYELHMNPIITIASTVQFEKRDQSLSQAQQIVELFKGLNVTEKKAYLKALTEILAEVFPQMGADALGWKIDVEPSEGGGDSDF